MPRLHKMPCLSAVLSFVLCAASAWLSSADISAAGMKEMNPPAAADETKTTALVGGRLIDGRGASPVEGAVVVIRGTKIVAVGERANVTVPAGAAVLDARGLSILPGLIDSHFHSRNNLKTPVEYELKRGVTSFRDPGHPFKYYDAVLQTKQTMPRVFLCGGHLDAHPPVWPDQAEVIQDAEQARRTVNEHVEKGASAIKVYFRLPLEHIRAACEAANERGVPVTAHLELVDADEAIRAGVRGIEHAASFGTVLAEPEPAKEFKAAVFEDSAARRAWRHRVWGEIDLDTSPRLKPLLTTIVENQVFISPTLALYEVRPGAKGSTEQEVRGFDNMVRFVGLCHKAGAKVVVGSHTAVPFAATGRAYQRELELLVEAGLSPLETITAGTLHNAQFLGIDDRLGTLEAGKTADVILIEGDPSREIGAMQNVRHVMLNGIWVGPAPKAAAADGDGP
jgi:imidazolonepropionase-like amidohydrolase